MSFSIGDALMVAVVAAIMLMPIFIAMGGRQKTRIITSSQQERALYLITEIRRALLSEDLKKRLFAVDYLAELCGIVGGIEGLKAELERIEAEKPTEDEND